MKRALSPEEIIQRHNHATENLTNYLPQAEYIERLGGTLTTLEEFFTYENLLERRMLGNTFLRTNQFVNPQCIISDSVDTNNYHIHKTVAYEQKVELLLSPHLTNITLGATSYETITNPFPHIISDDKIFEIGREGNLIELESYINTLTEDDFHKTIKSRTTRRMNYLHLHENYYTHLQESDIIAKQLLVQQFQQLKKRKFISQDSEIITGITYTGTPTTKQENGIAEYIQQQLRGYRKNSPLFSITPNIQNDHEIIFYQKGIPIYYGQRISALPFILEVQNPYHETHHSKHFVKQASDAVKTLEVRDYFTIDKIKPDYVPYNHTELVVVAVLNQELLDAFNS